MLKIISHKVYSVGYWVGGNAQFLGLHTPARWDCLVNNRGKALRLVLGLIR
jgi:hypothetical protein